VIFIAVAVWYFTNQGGAKSGAGTTPDSKSTPATTASSDGPNSTVPVTQSGNPPSKIPVPSVDDDGEGFEEEDVRPAIEIYKNADEALQAVKNASKNYDAIVLEQFAAMSANCAWCEPFYVQLSELMVSPDRSQDERSYYAEVLAMSGR